MLLLRGGGQLGGRYRKIQGDIARYRGHLVLLLRGGGQRGGGGQRKQQPLGAPEGEGLRAERVGRRARQAHQRLRRG